ncbi:outer membrane protein assembly factor BamE [Mycoavidus sp. B2-EB]|uniref:outer membrane protein assembly factor BamE n=1 Tax=Mycoavidus sp. B2-EB TaxID=2651972 RepID=UPI003085FB83|nr:outer membrane protein assembly factor BamE [Mycoavidus sp. B2-EB]
MKLFFFTFNRFSSLAFPQTIRRRPLALACAMWLAACSTYNDTTQRIAQHITPYQITVVQGNFISREAVAKLQVGMPREHVRAVLGTPLLIDTFHPHQWDYIFYFKRGATEVVQRRHLAVYFERDQLSRWVGGEDLPSENELLAEIDGDRRANTRSKQNASARSPRADNP